MTVIVLAPRQASRMVVRGRNERARTMAVECNNVYPVCFQTERGAGKREDSAAELLRSCKRCLGSFGGRLNGAR